MAIPMELRELSRRKLRYRLYRIQNGNPVDKDDGIKQFFEGQEEFDGWHNFAVTWDVGKEGEFPKGHWVSVSREKSMMEEWQEVVQDLVQDFPTNDVTDKEGDE